ncbi:MAG: DUF2911 domain-containing protein [Bernardetiaceae bacterium]
MKHLSLFIVLMLSLSVGQAVAQNVQLPRSSPRAEVVQEVGLSQVRVRYSRPAVAGREGKLWGSLVHYGLKDLGFGTSKASPWRAGANETTQITFSDQVQIEGQGLPAGTYGLYMILEEGENVTVIFSKNATAWGSYFYDPSEDALRVQVRWRSAPYTERLTYDFTQVNENQAIMALRWEKREIPIQIRFDTEQVVLQRLRRELQGVAGFSWQGYYQAARYCLDKKTNQEEGLRWISASIGLQANFNNHKTKAELLNQLGRDVEAEVAMREALTYADAQQIHQYGRTLIMEKKIEQAVRIFEMNANRNPDTWPVNVGLARAYSAQGNFKKALRYARIAAAEAPNEQERTNIAEMIRKLERNQDIN